MTNIKKPLRVHGLDLSYFTGKFEAYLRFARIPHERDEISAKSFERIGQATGVKQMPAVEFADGTWATDSTPMILTFDAQHPERSVFPGDPAMRFLVRLLEDYADEWLWRPALHYRWSFEPDARLMSHRIATEMLHDMPLPLALKRWLVKRRQLRRYVWGDAVTPATRAHVEAIYLRNLAALQAVFAQRPFLLGARPCLADFGFFASMFRHFGLDPTPARIMRDTAPAVYEWLARMWNSGALEDLGDWPSEAPSDLQPFWNEIGACYLPYLTANARATTAGLKRFTWTVEGVTYTTPVHAYRVTCLDVLRTEYSRLSIEARAAVGRVIGPGSASLLGNEVETQKH
jgi:glutathione S-transferase